MNNRCNKFLSAFALLDKKIYLENCLCDNFTNCFSFYSYLHNAKDQLHKLDGIIISTSLDPLTCIIISDASISQSLRYIIKLLICPPQKPSYLL